MLSQGGIQLFHPYFPLRSPRYSNTADPGAVPANFRISAGRLIP
jgi:hypothetical protein